MSEPGHPPATLRFVVLWHDGVPDPHFDLMIESRPGGTLYTWRCARNPLTQYVTPARRLRNHRRHYLSYEGQVSGDRGRVTRVADGACSFARHESRAWIWEVTGPALYPRYWIAAALRGRGWIIEGVTNVDT